MANKSTEIKKLIAFLQKNNFVAECNACGEALKLKNTNLFAMDEFTPEAEEIYKQMKAEIAERRKHKLKTPPNM